MDEDCCKDDTDLSNYSGRFVDATKGHAGARGRRRKFSLDDLEV